MGEFRPLSPGVGENSPKIMRNCVQFGCVSYLCLLLIAVPVDAGDAPAAKSEKKQKPDAATEAPAKAKKLDMQKYLQDTKALVRQEKYEEALDRCLWFHEHALEHDPAMYGVRLSFALNDWMELGKVYPPAKKAMIEIRDGTTKEVTESGGTVSQFHDAMALNRTLGEEAKTVELFENLDKKHPKKAQLAWHVAKDSVIEAKRIDLIRKYITDVVKEFGDIKAQYDLNVRFYDKPQIGGAQFKAYNENHFVTESLQLITIALALDKPAAAKEIQKLALAVIDDPRLRDAIPATAKPAAQK